MSVKITCSVCKEDLDESCFYMRKDGNNVTYRKDCKSCCKVRSKTRSIFKKDEIVEWRSDFYKKNKEMILTKNRQYRFNNKETVKNCNKKWLSENKERLASWRKVWKNQWKSNRYKTDMLFRMKENLRTRYAKSLKTKKMLKTSKFAEYLGCELQFLKDYLSEKFDSHMKWDNYGIKGWHIDHIIPLDSAKTEEELVKLLHYTNLQPLWCTDNYSKGCKHVS